jgi:predicted DNA-binding transcriptional regulator AlpA
MGSAEGLRELTKGRCIMDAVLVDTKEASRILGIAESTLETMRCRQTPGQPSFVRMGRRIVRYNLRSLEKYIADHTVEVPNESIRA